jgi:hypothetical protein
VVMRGMGPCTFRHGASKKAFAYLGAYAWPMDAADNGMTQNGTRGEPAAGPTRMPGLARGPEKPTQGQHRQGAPVRPDGNRDNLPSAV